MDNIRQRLWQKAAARRVPLIGAFELLPTCNLQCKMCYVRKTAEEVRQVGGLIPAGQWLDWARQAADAGLLYPLLTGGEPFLREDLPQILTGMQQMGLQVSINTNATLVDESMARWLSRHCPTRLNITLYGACDETYKALCGDGGAFDNVRRAVGYLKRYNVPVKFNASITPYNIQDLDEIMAYAKSVGSPIQVATYMFPPLRRSGTVGQNDRLTPEQAAQARVRADYLQNNPAFFRAQARAFSHFVPPTEEMLAAQAAGNPHEMTCRAGRSSFWLDWQGRLGCCGIHSVQWFSLKDAALSEAWRQVVEMTNTLRYSPVCTNCPNFRLCHCCAAMVYTECGEYGGYPQYLCRMNAAAARLYQDYARLLPLETGEAQEAVPNLPMPDCEL
ncbi:MAG: radical SAM protein [Faecousia sp.]